MYLRRSGRISCCGGPIQTTPASSMAQDDVDKDLDTLEQPREVEAQEVRRGVINSKGTINDQQSS